MVMEVWAWALPPQRPLRPAVQNGLPPQTGLRLQLGSEEGTLPRAVASAFSYWGATNGIVGAALATVSSTSLS